MIAAAMIRKQMNTPAIPAISVAGKKIPSYNLQEGIK